MLDSFSKTQILIFFLAAGLLSVILFKIFNKVHAENFYDYENEDDDDDKYIY